MIGAKWVNAIMFPAIGLATYLSLIFYHLSIQRNELNHVKTYCGNQNVVESIHGWVMLL